MIAVAIALGAGVGLGLILLLRGLRPAGRAWPTRRLRSSGRGVRHGLIVTASAVAAWALTGWPVLGLVTAVGSVAVPRALSTARRRSATERSEAVARWVEMLRDTIAGAAGLEEAVAITARRPPPAIRPAVERLATRLRHQPLVSALQGFASEVPDPGADLLVAALVTAATHETRDLGHLLSALAEATRAQVRMRRSVDAGRAHVRSATRMVLVVTGVFVAALCAFSREYLAPYATVEGQLWLGVVGLVFFGALALLARLDRIDVPAHHLAGGVRHVQEPAA